MSFRLLRVKRKADQDPAAALYWPIEDDTKRPKSVFKEKEFRLFKIIERGDRTPIKVINPTERNISFDSKVVLLTNSMDASTVAEAILIDPENSSDKKEISKLIKSSDIFNKFDSLNMKEESDGYVYDTYRLDLGKFSTEDIETRSNCIQIVTYEQEFLTNEDASESDTFEDDCDSNAEDYYANDYPDEESYKSENYEDDLTEAALLAGDFGNDDELVFDESYEIQDLEDGSEFDFALDFDSDDCICTDNDSFCSDNRHSYRNTGNDAEDESFEF